MTDISLYDITFVVEDDDGNSKLYTTNMDYDHSFIASLVDLDDLVPIEGDVKNAETFNADVKMDDRAWVAYYEYNFMNVRPENPENITGDSKMVSFRDYRKELYGIYLTTQEAKKAFNLLKGSLMGHGDWKDGQYQQVINGYKQIYGGTPLRKTIPMQMKFEYVPIKRFGYDTAMHTKTKNAETFEARENKDGTIVLTDNEWNSCIHLFNGHYLWGNLELKLIDDGLKNSAKFKKEKIHSYDALQMIYLYERLLSKRKVRGYPSPNKLFDVEFNEWADQELMSHGKDISFKDWAQDEGMKHGNTEITEWAQHEDESHDARYGAETFESEEDWYGLKLKERFSMDDWQGWSYEDGDITISIDGSNGVITRESGMSIEEARAYLHRKGIPFDNSTDCSNKSCIHADEYDLVYFNYPNHEKCYKCDWSNVYVRDTQYDDDGEGSVVFGQRCNYGLCNTERRGYVGGEVSWEAESFGAETFEAEGNTQWDKTLAMINQYDMKGIDGASFAYNPTGPRKNELPPFFNKDLVDTHPDFNGDYFNENVVVFIDWCGDKPRNYGTYQGSLHVSPRISKQKVIKQLQDWGIDTTNHKTWKNFGYYDDWGEGKGYTIYNFPLPNTSLCQWSNAYVRDTEYDDDGTAYTTFGQDCIKCNNQRRGSISGDVSWDMNAETSGQWEIGEQLEEAQMNAEFLYYYVLNEKGESPADFDTLEEAQAYVANSNEPLEIYERRSRDDEADKMDKKMNAETFDDSFITTDMNYNAEGKKRKKRSDLLSEPLEGTSLDSGEWKGILTGIGLFGLGLFGYSKLRK